jgi:hypothetical protein
LCGFCLELVSPNPARAGLDKIVDPEMVETVTVRQAILFTSEHFELAEPS